MHALSRLLGTSQIKLRNAMSPPPPRANLPQASNTHISDKRHAPGRNDIEKRLDLAEPLKVCSNLLRVRAVLLAGAYFQTLPSRASPLSRGMGNSR